MTAPRETGGEGTVRVCSHQWAHRGNYRYECMNCSATIDSADTLATPRPVEVTEEMAELRAMRDEWDADSLERFGVTWTTLYRSRQQAKDGATLSLDEVAAALRAQPAGGTPTGDAVAWLLTFAVEQVIDGTSRPTWVKGFALASVRDLGSTHPFATRPTLRPVPTHDHNEAMRFVRKRDAEAALSALEGTSYAALLKAEEHMWCDRTYPVAAPVADAGGTRDA